MGTYIDPKLASGAGVGPAAAVVLWIVLYMTFGTVRTFAEDDPLTFGLLITATGALFGGLLGYWTRNAASPLPADTKPGAVEPVAGDELHAMLADPERFAGGAGYPPPGSTTWSPPTPQGYQPPETGGHAPRP